MCVIICVYFKIRQEAHIVHLLYIISSIHPHAFIHNPEISSTKIPQIPTQNSTNHQKKKHNKTPHQSFHKKTLPLPTKCMPSKRSTSPGRIGAHFQGTLTRFLGQESWRLLPPLPSVPTRQTDSPQGGSFDCPCWGDGGMMG